MSMNWIMVFRYPYLPAWYQVKMGWHDDRDFASDAWIGLNYDSLARDFGDFTFSSCRAARPETIRPILPHLVELVDRTLKEIE